MHLGLTDLAGGLRLLQGRPHRTRNLIELVEVFQADGDLADRRRVHAQQGRRILDVHVAVLSASTRTVPVVYVLVRLSATIRLISTLGTINPDRAAHRRAGFQVADRHCAHDIRQPATHP
jgi:hypothetical protein